MERTWKQDVDTTAAISNDIKQRNIIAGEASIKCPICIDGRIVSKVEKGIALHSTCSTKECFESYSITAVTGKSYSETLK